jgi:sulfotransferase
LARLYAGSDSANDCRWGSRFRETQTQEIRQGPGAAACGFFFGEKLTGWDNMDKPLHFICGLPRSGATLLCNILAQNPRFHCTSPAGILDVMFLVRRQWNETAEFLATPNEAGKERVLKSLLENYYAAGGITRPVLFDKSRAWLGMIEMAERLLDRPVKILVPVRDVRDVLASFENIWRRSQQMRELTEKSVTDSSWETAEGRCEIWIRGDQPVGLCYNRIKDALARGYRDRIHFVEYEELTRNPGQTLADISAFLGEPRFDYDFNEVVQVTSDFDEMYPIQGLPSIRPKVESTQPRWPFVLGPWADKYASNNHLWRQFRVHNAMTTEALVASPGLT